MPYIWVKQDIQCGKNMTGFDFISQNDWIVEVGLYLRKIRGLSVKKDESLQA